MNWLFRLVFTVPLLALSGFCLFGFVATFEPLPPIEQWTWRAVYCVVAMVAGWTIVRLWRPAPSIKPGQDAPGRDR